MRKAILAIVVIALAAALVFVVMVKYHGGNSAGDKRPARGKSIAASRAARTNESSTFVSWQFETWQPDNLHWDAPSSLNISDDGTWYAFASRLENQRRTGGFFDTGSTYAYDITVNFYPVFNAATQSCQGAALYGTTLHVDTLGYKDVHTNVTTHGQDPQIREIAGRADCATAALWMH